MSSTSAEDPVITHSRREAIGVLVIWLIAMSYSVGYCYQRGYGKTAADLRFVWGFPDWVFWGLVVPWTVCVGLAWLYAAWIMHDADLGDDRDEGFSLDGDEAGGADG